MSNKVCGREYSVIPPIIKHDMDRRKASARVIVEGLNHPKGEPIRFKSKERAERHIQNMRLER